VAVTATTVVWDLGGVLIRWDPAALYRDLLPAERVGPFLDEIGFAEWNHRQDAGRPMARAVTELSVRFPHHADLIAAYPAYFDRTLLGPVPQSVQLLAELRARRVRLLALTNWSAETFHHARARYDFLEWFEDILVSGEELLAKPDPQIFDLLVRRYSLRPAETVFIDDSRPNVTAASAAGLVALHFTDPDLLRSQLAALGLLDRSGPAV
jgi:2-haloacid dehalogenase